MRISRISYKKLIYLAVFISIISAGILAFHTISGKCITVHAETNENGQNYSEFANTVYSYLTTDAKGHYIRVQAKNDGTVTVYYYDRNFNYIKEIKLKKELPIFGAFYETDTNYYILTAQSNPNQNDKKEVYRITKYDKNFKRISSCGIKAEKTQTYSPIYGSARITHQGRYLYINTAQTSYALYDGLHHQSSECLRVDTKSMKMEAYEIGFVSHSYDQHILVDGNKIWTADINDASSSIVLNYRTIGDNSDIIYNSKKLMRADPTMEGIWSIYLGISMGSFKASDTSFMVAGTYDIDYNKESGRDVFVVSMDKETGSVNMNYLTNSVENVDYPTTPHMVEIGKNKYMVLWSKDNYVYYTCVDGNGETITKTYKMRGALSDCVPIVVNNQVTWYVYTDNKVDFYQINAKALSNTKKITKTSKVNEVKNLKIKKAAKSSITLSWSKTSRAKGYIIYRYDNSTHKWVNIGKTTKLTYTDKKLASKTSYKYKVKAYRIISGKTYTGKSSGINARTK